ncbi:MAG TPA: SAM-dependent methyltransferase [Candidatus Dojkabacteria bacterium]|nr:SAM-dependent methyltransferase [Candidatus Dojkabacteria bacterium]
MKNTGTLYLIPTSLSKRPLVEELKESDLNIVRTLSYFIVETPKIARSYFKGLGVVIQELDMRVLDEHTKQNDIPFLIEPLVQGFSMGLMTDAGCPGVGDPGSLVVRECHRLGIKVVPLVGPSSIILSLMASGLNGQRFRFLGYLPKNPESRRKMIKRIENESIRNNESEIFIEAPYRNKRLFDDLMSVCNANTELTVAVDLTGKNEDIRTMKISEWKMSKNINILDIPSIYILLGKK